ncbi:hypothetical protein ACP275_05G046800 [Erythranthe tilingii]
MKNSYNSIMIGAFLLMLVLIAGTCEGQLEEKWGRKKCHYKSEKHFGICISSTKCSTICKIEGFEGGRCHGFRRRCYCYKHC